MLHCFGHIHEGWGAERVTWAREAADINSTPSDSLESWKESKWKLGVAQGGQQIEAVEVRLDGYDGAKERHGAFVDLTEASGQGLRRGAETLFVNASVMSVEYRPVNAPWVLDLHLPARALKRLSFLRELTM